MAKKTYPNKYRRRSRSKKARVQRLRFAKLKAQQQTQNCDILELKPSDLSVTCASNEKSQYAELSLEQGKDSTQNLSFSNQSEQELQTCSENFESMIDHTTATYVRQQEDAVPTIFEACIRKIRSKRKLLELDKNVPTHKDVNCCLGCKAMKKPCSSLNCQEIRIDKPKSKVRNKNCPSVQPVSEGTNTPEDKSSSKKLKSMVVKVPISKDANVFVDKVKLITLKDISPNTCLPAKTVTQDANVLANIVKAINSGVNHLNTSADLKPIIEDAHALIDLILSINSSVSSLNTASSGVKPLIKDANVFIDAIKFFTSSDVSSSVKPIINYVNDLIEVHKSIDLSVLFLNTAYSSVKPIIKDAYAPIDRGNSIKLSVQFLNTACSTMRRINHGVKNLIERLKSFNSSALSQNNTCSSVEPIIKDANVSPDLINSGIATLNAVCLSMKSISKDGNVLTDIVKLINPSVLFMNETSPGVKSIINDANSLIGLVKSINLNVESLNTASLSENPLIKGANASVDLAKLVNSSVVSLNTASSCMKQIINDANVLIKQLNSINSSVVAITTACVNMKQIIEDANNLIDLSNSYNSSSASLNSACSTEKPIATDLDVSVHEVSSDKSSCEALQSSSSSARPISKQLKVPVGSQNMHSQFSVRKNVQSQKKQVKVSHKGVNSIKSSSNEIATSGFSIDSLTNVNFLYNLVKEKCQEITDLKREIQSLQLMNKKNDIKIRSFRQKEWHMKKRIECLTKKVNSKKETNDDFVVIGTINGLVK